MAAQGVQGHRTDSLCEDPQSVQFNVYENTKVRVNQGSEQKTDSNGKKSRMKSALLVICLNVTIACTVTTIVLFAKVMNNEELHIQLNSLSTNFNITNLEGKVYMKLSEVGARLNVTINVISELQIAGLLPVEKCTQTSKNGVYTLTTREQVYCSNGWTVFPKRMDGSIPDFHTKTWKQYSEGFGNMTGEYWLGLIKLHNITGKGGCRLRVDLQTFDNETAYAEYSQFSVANEANLFRLTVGGYNGTAGDSLNPSTSKFRINGMSFSTNDRDNDKWRGNNCAVQFSSGGWWYNDCFFAAPNGAYGYTRPGGLGIYASTWQTLRKTMPMKFTQFGVGCD